MQTPTTSSTTRRRLLGWWTALAGTVGALAAPALARGADPHVAWKRELDAVVARINATGALPAGAEDALYAEQFRLLGLIGETPAGTPAGIAAQIRVAHDSAERGEGISGSELQDLRNAIASLERLSAA